MKGAVWWVGEVEPKFIYSLIHFGYVSLTIAVSISNNVYGIIEYLIPTINTRYTLIGLYMGLILQRININK